MPTDTSLTFFAIVIKHAFLIKNNATQKVTQAVDYEGIVKDNKKLEQTLLGNLYAQKILVLKQR